MMYVLCHSASGAADGSSFHCIAITGGIVAKNAARVYGLEKSSTDLRNRLGKRNKKVAVHPYRALTPFFRPLPRGEADAQTSQPMPGQETLLGAYGAVTLPSRVEPCLRRGSTLALRGRGFHPALDQGDAHAPLEPQHKVPRPNGRGLNGWGTSMSWYVASCVFSQWCRQMPDILQAVRPHWKVHFT